MIERLKRANARMAEVVFSERFQRRALAAASAFFAGCFVMAAIAGKCPGLVGLAAPLIVLARASRGDGE